MWELLIGDEHNSEQGRQSFPVSLLDSPKASPDPSEVILQKGIWR